MASQFERYLAGHRGTTYGDDHQAELGLTQHEDHGQGHGDTHGHGHTDEVIHGLRYGHSNQYPHPHMRRKIWPGVLETFYALAVFWAVATFLAFLSLFLPTNGIPAIVGIVFGITAIFCFIFIWFIKTRWRRWLMAGGVGLGFYVLMTVAFWA